MSKKKILAILTGTATVATAIAAYEAKKKADKTTYEANLIEPIKKRKRGIYEKYIKRAFDVVCATGAIVVFSPVYLGVAVLVKLKLYTRSPGINWERWQRNCFQDVQI